MAIDRKHHPIEGPVGWRGSEMAARSDWIRSFNAAELDEIDRAVRGARGLDLVDVSRERFPLPTLAPVLEAIATELEHGRGMVMLRGLPLAYDEADLRLAYWGLGTWLGTAVTQSPRGEFLQEVKDYGETVELTKSRGSRTTRLLPFHADRCDVVGLLCVRPSKSGGASRVVSAAAIHNAILEHHPQLLDTFYSPFNQSRQGEEPEGADPFFSQPIFSFHEGRFTGQFSPAYIRFAQLIPGCPPLTDTQKAALDLFGRLSDELSLAMDFRPGDIQLLNNHTIYHARTAFEDHPEPARKRLLLRLWLSMPNSRALPPSHVVNWGATAAGAVRGGVMPRNGSALDVEAERRRRATAAG